LDAFRKAITLQVTKSLDYSAGPVCIADHYPFGRVSAADKINGKALRLVSMASNPNSPTNHESVMDTYLDLINYAAMAWMVEKKRQVADTETPAPSLVNYSG